MAQITIVATSTPVTNFVTTLDSPTLPVFDTDPLTFDVTISEQGGSQDTSLSFGETVNVVFDEGDGPQTLVFEYRGFLSLNGSEYPAFFYDDPTDPAWLVVGIELDQSAFPDANALQAQLNTTDAFTDFATVCFAPGTAIATPDGARPVEDLGIGDLVTRADGGVSQVTWIGRQRLRPWLGGPGKARLVRIAAGALGAGLPLRDLWVTPDHAIRIDGLLVNAGALVNGATITLDPIKAETTVYHVETEAHDVILAEGVAAETFVDYVGRQAFDNHGEYVALYGDARPIAENPAPRVTHARMLPSALRARLGLDQAA